MLLKVSSHCLLLAIAASFSFIALGAVSVETKIYPISLFQSTKLEPFTDKEQKDLNRAIGRCSCEVRVGDKVGRSSADCTLAGINGTNTIVIGAGHMVRDFFINNVPMPGLKCQFANNAGSEPVRLVFKPGFYAVGNLDKSDVVNDRLVAKLARKIPGAKEIHILRSGGRVRKEMPVYAVSAGLKDVLGTDELVVQEPTILAADVLAFLDNSTAIKVKSSGAPYLMRSNGQLVMIGMVQGGSREDKDGQPSSVPDPSTGAMIFNNVTRGIIFGAGAAKEILAIEQAK